jgi:hypothetical protein
LVSGYILHKIETVESAVTSVTVKDEVAIWLSRYKPPVLHKFVELMGYTSPEIVCPTIEDQVDAAKSFGKYSLRIHRFAEPLVDGEIPNQRSLLLGHGL